MERKSNQNIVMNEELVQNIVMDEELIQNVAMGEKFVKNFVMDPKIDPNVEMGSYPCLFLVGGKLCISETEKLVEEFIEEAATVALLIGSLSGDSSLVMRCAGTSTCEGLREMVQCYRRQHFGASNDLHENPTGIYEDEIHEHSDGIFKDGIGTE